MKASARLAWTALCFALMSTAMAAQTATPTQPSLHDALIALDSTPGTALDAATVHRLKALIGQYGWPTVKNAGRDGVDAIGHLTERAGIDEDFQGDAESHFASRIGIDIDALAFAALNDRIEVSHQRPQQFGTLLALEKGKVVTSPAIKTSTANAYRDSAGLPFLDVYLKQIQAQVDSGKSLADAAAIPRLSTENHPVSNPQLRTDLHDMVSSEQVARTTYVVKGMKEGSAEQKRIIAIDAAHLPRIKAIFDKVGFPNAAMVGRSGVSNFFLLTQHADKDPAFQAKVLEKAEPLMRNGELSRQQFALLTDRVLLAQGKKQRYGSQVEVKDGRSVPLPMEDAAHVDEQRATMGLEPLDDYLKESDAMYAPATAASSH
jgi:hypothetical protein